jgi:acetolactate synthase small subunit
MTRSLTKGLGIARGTTEPSSLPVGRKAHPFLTGRPTQCATRRYHGSMTTHEIRPKPMTPMRHIIAILLQNEAGALARVAGLFSTRGYNIESLSVAATDDPTVSRLTLVTKGSDAVIQQIANQLNKLVDVVNVEDMTLGEHLERELVLLKLKVRPGAYRYGPRSRRSTRRSRSRSGAGRLHRGAHRKRSGGQHLRERARARCGAPRSGSQRRAGNREKRASLARCTVVQRKTLVTPSGDGPL